MRRLVVTTCIFILLAATSLFAADDIWVSDPVKLDHFPSEVPIPNLTNSKFCALTRVTTSPVGFCRVRKANQGWVMQTSSNKDAQNCEVTCFQLMSDREITYYYRFEEGPENAPANKITDALDNKHDGLVLGSPTYSKSVNDTVPRTGQPNKYSMRFRQTDAATFAYPFPFQTFPNATLELWVYPNQTELIDSDFIWTTTGGYDKNRFNFHLDPNAKKVCLDYRDPDGIRHDLGCSDNGSVPFGQWSYLAFVKQENVYSIYINNSVTSNATKLYSQVPDPQEPNLPTSTSWTINGRARYEPNPGAQFDGLLDEIRLTNKALRPSQFLVNPK